MVTLGKSFNPKGNTMSDRAAILPTPTPPPEPEWIAFGDGGFRLKGTNWTATNIEVGYWRIKFGRVYMGMAPSVSQAKDIILEYRCLIVEEPVP